MKDLLRCLLTVILLSIASISGSESALLGPTEESNETAAIDIATHYISSASSDAVPCLPRQTSYASAPRLQHSFRRGSNIQKCNFEFVKAGKALNTGIINYIQREYFHSKSLFVKPANRLISLGKLII